jgi:hypothetical protein
MPYDSTDYVTKSAIFSDLKAEYGHWDEFPTIPTVTQTINRNQSWIVVTTSVSHPDGSRSQTTAIEPKPR